MSPRTRTGSLSRLAALWRCLLGASLFASAFCLAACNTTEGAGKDIEELGEGIQDAAD